MKTELKDVCRLFLLFGRTQKKPQFRTWNYVLVLPVGQRRRKSWLRMKLLPMRDPMSNARKVGVFRWFGASWSKCHNQSWYENQLKFAKKAVKQTWLFFFELLFIHSKSHSNLLPRQMFRSNCTQTNEHRVINRKSKVKIKFRFAAERTNGSSIRSKRKFVKSSEPIVAFDVMEQSWKPDWCDLATTSGGRIVINRLGHREKVAKNVTNVISFTS